MSKGLGEHVIEGIIRENLVRVDVCGMLVWKPGAAEQIEAIIVAGLDAAAGGRRRDTWVMTRALDLRG